MQNELHKRKAELYEEAKRKKMDNLQVKEESDPVTSEKPSSDCVEPESSRVEPARGVVEPARDVVEPARDVVEPASDGAKEPELDKCAEDEFKDEL